MSCNILGFVSRQGTEEARLPERKSRLVTQDITDMLVRSPSRSVPNQKTLQSPCNNESSGGEISIHDEYPSEGLTRT